MNLCDEIEKESFSELKKVKEEAVCILGNEIRYRLFRLSCFEGISYVIQVRSNCENSVCIFGSEKDDAERIFSKIVSGKVTPCTLADISEDFYAVTAFFDNQKT